MADDADESPVMQTYYRARTLRALGSAVSGARRAAGLSQDDVAQASASSRPTVSRLERGQPVSVETVLAALAACGYELVVAPRGARLSVEP